MPPVCRKAFRTSDKYSVCPPELRPGDREPPDSVPQAERFGEEPPELHPGPAEGRTLRWTGFPEATQWFPHLSGGSDWCSQEPASLAWQVGKMNLGIWPLIFRTISPVFSLSDEVYLGSKHHQLCSQNKTEKNFWNHKISVSLVLLFQYSCLSPIICEALVLVWLLEIHFKLFLYP